MSKSNAYLITDSRYWLQARNELDENWILIPAGAPDGPVDWIEWLVVRPVPSSLLHSLFSPSLLSLSLPFFLFPCAHSPPRPRAQDRAQDSKIGLDARMIAHDKASALQARLAPKNARLAFPPQNLVDLLWKDRPARSRSAVYVQPIEYTGAWAGFSLLPPSFLSFLSFLSPPRSLSLSRVSEPR